MPATLQRSEFTNPQHMMREFSKKAMRPFHLQNPFSYETPNQNKLNKNSNKKNAVMQPLSFQNEKLSHFQNLVHSNVEQTQIKTFIIQLYKGIRYSLKSLKGPNPDFVLKKRVTLKQRKNAKNKFLFLDLDETLIHTNRDKDFKDGQPLNTQLYQLFIRQYAFEFLENISQYYDVYVFTAATKQYAEAVIAKLNSRKKVIQDYLCRDHCFKTQKGKCIKDLRIVENRSLKDMIIVDNKVESFGLQIDNGIPILEFYGSKQDCELQHLQKLLIKFSTSEDVRKSISEHFKLKQLGELSKQDVQEYLIGGSPLRSSAQKMIDEIDD